MMPDQRNHTTIDVRERCSVVDLFSGVGGLTHGFVRENFNVVAGVDNDASCEYAYAHNNNARFIHKNIEDLTADEILELYPEGHEKILIGCAPCQPYSKYGRKRNTGGRWRLVESFADIIEEVDPDVVSMENVPELRDYKEGEIFDSFVHRLETAGYKVVPYDVYGPDYGIPQQRTRLVLFASKYGKVELIEKTHSPENYIPVGQVLEEMEEIEAGEVSKKDPLHRSSRLSDKNLKRIRQSVPGGTWRDWDEELLANCHKKASGSGYVSVYGRMRADEPAPTITTQFYGYGNGRFGHPEQDRAISLREGALIQTFPPDYEFVRPGDKYYIKTIGRHIGNAVPVRLGEVIAKSIKRHLEKYLDAE